MRELADFLHRSRAQVAGVLGLRIVLTNRDVTEAQVDEAFLRIRDRVKERPEDTVVVFLAGHADALRERFTCSCRIPPSPTSTRGPAVPWPP